MALNSWCIGATPYYQMERRLPIPEQGQDPVLGAALLRPEAGQLLDAYTQTTDDAKRKDLLDQAQTLLAEKLPVVPIYNNPIWYEYDIEAVHRLGHRRQSLRRSVELRIPTTSGCCTCWRCGRSK